MFRDGLGLNVEVVSPELFCLHRLPCVPGSVGSHQVLSSVMLYETITCKHVMVFLMGVVDWTASLGVYIHIYISNLGGPQLMLNTCHQLLWKRASEVIQHVLF